ncbi:MAG: hypothetical protein ACFNVK_11205, partial [Prevotella sp.]
TNYAMYGAKNKYNYTFSDAEIEAITGKELVDKLKNLNNVEQTVIYYGPATLSELTNKLKTFVNPLTNNTYHAPLPLERGRG